MIPELLSPAGNFEKMEAALRYGADAVYLAGNAFGMRSAADNFSREELLRASEYIHGAGKKMYVTVNTMPHPDEYADLGDYLQFLREVRPDALIMADLGVMALAKKICPELPIHVSTQASVVSAQAAEAYAALGAKRVVLARELTLAEITAIRRELSRDVELEAFIHGSMCVSYSGRCLLSNELTGRDANRGRCTQPCRWNYHLIEEKRPDEPLPIEEDDLGTYVLSSKDMCTVEMIPELIEAGISSFKIEGRMKSAYYTAVVTNAYRMAIDAYAAGNYAYDPRLKIELESVSHRTYGTGFYRDRPMENPQLAPSVGYVREKAYFAFANGDPVPACLAEKTDAGTLFGFTQKNKIRVGDVCELLTPGKVGQPFSVTELYDTEGVSVDACPHPSQKFFCRVPFDVNPGDILRSGDAENA